MDEDIAVVWSGVYNMLYWIGWFKFITIIWGWKGDSLSNQFRSGYNHAGAQTDFLPRKFDRKYLFHQYEKRVVQKM